MAIETAIDIQLTKHNIMMSLREKRVSLEIDFLYYGFERLYILNVLEQYLLSRVRDDFRDYYRVFESLVFAIFHSY